MSKQKPNDHTNQKPEKPKIGQGAIAALGRQGYKELGSIVAAFPGHSPLVEEPGQLGRATQQSISRQTGASQPVHFYQSQPEIHSTMNTPEPNQADVQMVNDQQPSVLDDLVQHAQQQAEFQEPEQEQEMDQ
ncbi:hypothetical protein DTL42_16100 [Bremerella cremea]|uniref:Uncharacterized protein n=1 Tax=Bremerella cremea TaxID=1031537 RepID=A0A368KS77_9BACT|nr:hypothetical protein [Bremerella cremea]RCS46478.1 hypothetical protein DTL42_16100 [Bremerella cremea]